MKTKDDRAGVDEWFLWTRCCVCGQHMEFPARGVGELVRCPHCGSQVVLADGITRWPEVEAKRVEIPIPADRKARCDPRATALFWAPAIIIGAHMVGQFLMNSAAWNDVVMRGFGLFLGWAIYMAPTCVACERRHRNALAIALLNLLAGWTLLGWVVALIWAVYKERAAP